MKYGKTIEIFLVDGIADGIVTAELSNWNGKAIKIPRIKVKDSQRTDITFPGIYFLFCENNSVYIGEAENIQERLTKHIYDYNTGVEKYYWAIAVCFVSEVLNKALIRYIENKIFELAKDNGNYTILTKNTCKNVVLKESQIASMEEFIDNIKILIKTLGYSVIGEKDEIYNKQTIFYCKGNNANAKGYPSINGFTVLEGSKISEHIALSFEKKSYYLLRQKLIEHEIIVNNLFIKNYEFSSPSAASGIVLGRPSNGNEDWKTNDGIKLKDYEN